MSREMFRYLLYLRLYSRFRKDLDIIYLDINEVKDYNQTYSWLFSNIE